ncbi:MAG: ribonuclease BN [Rhodobacterales bacterium]|nr:MAG: ribonuclease BN [Rhodobacterales bacterium]
MARSPWRRGWIFLRAIFDRLDRANVGLNAAGVAFFALFATFPALAALIAVFALLADPGIVAEQLDLLKEVIPPQAFDLFEGQIDKLLSSTTGGLTRATIVSIFLALWSARAGVAALIRGLNNVYGTRNRGGLRHNVVALLLTVALILTASVAMLAVIVTPLVLAAVNHVVPVAGSFQNILHLTRWGVALFVMVTGLGILYRFGPNRRGERSRWITPGALFVVLAWFGASILFSRYIADLARFTEVYGSIAAVIAVQLWMYLSAYLVLLGAVVNAEMPISTGAKQQGI